MGTRAYISKVNKDGTITGIYNHWDGYPEGLGKILFNAYDSESRVDELLSFGDVSAMDEDLDSCTFYHRDRDEDYETVKAQTHPTVAEAIEDSWYEYVYLYRSDLDTPIWECKSVYDNTVEPLKDVLENIDAQDD